MKRLELTPEEQERNDQRAMHELLPIPDCELFAIRIARAVRTAVYDAPIIVNIEGDRLLREHFARNTPYPVDFRGQRPIILFLGRLVKVAFHDGGAPSFTIEQRSEDAAGT